VAADGTVYAAGGGQDNGDSGTYAFDAVTGKQLWRTPGPSGPRPYAAGPGAAFGFSVTSGGTTNVLASSAATGRTLWTHDAGRMLDSAKVGWLAYAGEQVYIAAGTTQNSTTGQPTVRALDARTGRRVWAATIGVGPQEPTLAGSVLYTPDISSPIATTGRVVALHAATGTRLWQSAEIGGIPGLLVVTNGVVIGTALLTRSFKSAAFALDAATGRRLWHADVAGGAIAATDGMVFFFSTSISATGKVSPTIVSARYARSAKPAWTRSFAAETVPAAAGGVLYAGGDDRTLHAVAASTGDTLWSHRIAAPPVDIAVDGGALYALDQRGVVYALQV
jgi:outer membrane protein assembly factor BamB